MEEKLKALKEKARLYKVHSVVGPIIWIIFAFITGMIILPLIIGAMWVVVSLALKKMKQEEIQDHEKEYEEIRKLLSGDIQEININE